MNNKFDELLKNYYEEAKKANSPECDKILESMRANIRQRIGNENSYTISTSNKEIHIDKADLGDLREINGDLKLNASIDNNQEVNTDARQRQVEHNRYTPDKPYYK